MKRRLRRLLVRTLGRHPLLCKLCMTPMRQYSDRDAHYCTVCGHESTGLAVHSRGLVRAMIFGV